MNPEQRARVEEQQQEIITDFMQRMAASQPPKSAVEVAQAWGVDLPQLEIARRRTPLQQLRLMQAMAQFLVEARASLEIQKGEVNYEAQAGLREPATDSR